MRLFTTTARARDVHACTGGRGSHTSAALDLSPTLFGSNATSEARPVARLQACKMWSPICNLQLPSASTRPLTPAPVPNAAWHRHSRHTPLPQRTVPAAQPASEPAACRLRARCQAAGNDPFESLFSSTVFQSDIVRKEFGRVIDDLNTLRAMSAKFPEFDLEGKRMYLDKMEDACGRYEIFLKRLELSSDPAAKEYLRATNAQMLEAGFSLQMMFSGLKQSLDMYRDYVRAEEQVVSDPIAHQKFLKGLRASWGSETLKFMDISKMNPDNVMRAQKDPQFWRAIKEIKADPQKMLDWKEDANIGPLVREMWKLYMQQQ